MGSNQSSYAHDTNPRRGKGQSVRGRKYAFPEAPHGLDSSMVSEWEPSMHFASEDFSHMMTNSEEVEELELSDDGDEESIDEDEDSIEEEDEFWEERLHILEESRQLKLLANYFAHPEAPIHADGTTFARCYFDRPSTFERLSLEDANERAHVMEDLAALKQEASYYLHPEAPVVTSDPFACGRNYFERLSAEDQTVPEDDCERAHLLADANALQKLAIAYHHPEISVKTQDSFAFGRNYFSRPSADLHQSADDVENSACVLRDVQALKKMASDFLHPESPVVLSDPTCYGRNFFNRPSANVEDEIEHEQKSRVLDDVAKLKQLASNFLHPEKSVEIDSSCFGRNYFNRLTATLQDTIEEVQEGAKILEDIKALKNSAKNYMHPENSVVTTDPFACGRNYYSRPSVEVQVDSEEYNQILSDALALKKAAVDFMHPELPVLTSDPFACGRNYFSRPSADFAENDEDRVSILEDAKILKTTVVGYMHPELPVVTSDSTTFGRNYFTRPSADITEDQEDAEERARVLAEAQALKKVAEFYMHPEHPVVVDTTFFGRNYYGRASAIMQESIEDSQERAQLLSDAMALKKLSIDYLHPEHSVATSDPFVFGRNFYTRFSAEREESIEEANERARIKSEAQALKKAAVDYFHPEIPVVTSDSTACGRNYFSRFSAEPQNSLEDMEEMSLVSNDSQALKALAIDYLHPEYPVNVTDPFVTGRNYFNRFSAVSENDGTEERERILSDAKALRQVATDYLHPENKVVTTDPTACGRNYFARKSARGHYHMIHTFPVHDEDETEHHEHLDHFGMDDEMENVFEDMRQQLHLPQDNSHHYDIKKPQQESSEDGGNLSRSPSSVMLFTEESIYD